MIIQDEGGESWLVERGDPAFPLVDRIAKEGYEEIALFKEDIITGAAKDREVLSMASKLAQENQDELFLRFMTIADCYRVLGRNYS